MRRRRPGMSFVEVMVACCILSVLAIAVLTAITHSAKEVQTTSEYSLSLFMSQKIVEQVLQSVHENPYTDQDINNLVNNRMSVTDGLNPFFSPLEDTAADYGRLQPLRDVQIQPEASNLFQLYHGYDMTILGKDHQVEELPDKPYALKTVGVRYQWPGLNASVREFTLPVIIPRQNAPPQVTPLIAQDLPGMDKSIRETLYPSRTGDLVTVVGQVGANLSVVRDLGAIMVVAESTGGQVNQIDLQIQPLLAQTPERDPTKSDNAETRIALGRLYEKEAALYWQALLYLKDPASRISTSFQASDVGGRDKVDPVQIHADVNQTIWFRTDFVTRAAEALRQYAIARSLQPTLSREPYRQYRLERKIVELIELKSMAQESPDVSYLKTYIDFLTGIYAGRNRAITNYLVEEKRRGATLRSLMDSQPVIRGRLDAADVAKGALQDLQRRVETDMFNGPSNPAARGDTSTGQSGNPDPTGRSTTSTTSSSQ